MNQHKWSLVCLAIVVIVCAGAAYKLHDYKVRLQLVEIRAAAAEASAELAASNCN